MQSEILTGRVYRVEREWRGYREYRVYREGSSAEILNHGSSIECTALESGARQ